MHLSYPLLGVVVLQVSLTVKGRVECVGGGCGEGLTVSLRHLVAYPPTHPAPSLPSR